jgi:conjugative relaxase-like TrwC/TraI family protein
VLSVAKLARGREAYYLATLASAREANGGLIEPEGRWLGRVAETLGLSGTVEPAALRAVLSGVDPTSGEVLSPHHDRVRVVAYDCTYSTPKSVSVLHALGPEEVQAQVRAGHEEAAGAALGYLERRGARVRRIPARGEPASSVPAAGFVAAAFLHRTSRAPDPHLHSHVLIANMSTGPDGRWSALDGRGLYLELRTARDLYETQLRSELTRRLAVSWRELQGAWADIAGIDPKLSRAFSRRSIEIEAALEQSGRSGPRARRIVSVRTRPEKDLGTPYESLVADWRERSYRLGLSEGRLAAVARRPRPGAVVSDRWAERALGEAGVLARDGTCGRGDLVRARCASLPVGAEVADVERDVDALVSAGRLVPLPGPASPFRRGLRASSDRPIPVGITEIVYTTPAILELHEKLGNLVRACPGAVELLTYDPGERLDALDKLGDLLSDPERLVTAFAPARAAAASFEAVTGIETVPVAQLGASRARLQSPGGSVLVLAEAQRLGPWELAAAIESALRRCERLILFAPSTSLEGRFGTASALAPHLDAFALRERAHEAGFASRASDSGAMTGEVERYRFAGREVVLATDGASARRELVRAWEREHALGRRVLVAAGDDAVVARLRDAVQDAGGSPDEVVETRRLAGALVGDRRSPGPGSRVVVLGTLPRGVPAEQAEVSVHVAVVPRQVSPADRVGRAAEVAQPKYLVSELGAVPEALSERAAWRKGAAAIEAFRRRWSITDRDHAVGDRRALQSLEVDGREELAATTLELDRALRSSERALAGLARHGPAGPGRAR